MKRELPEKKQEEEEQVSSWILNRTAEMIQQEVGDMILQYPQIQDPVKICEKLLGDYFVIQELHQITRGRYIRWVNLETGVLSNGGIVLDIQFKQTDLEENGETDTTRPTKKNETGVYILCRTYGGHFFNMLFNRMLVFQKLNDREKMYLDLQQAKIDTT